MNGAPLVDARLADTAPPPVRGGGLKRLLVGRALATEDARHHLLPRLLALPVFASDALSSNAYATEEILHVLILAGAGALGLSIPIAGAVALLLGIVIVSYRRTVMAYPRGGGSYIVTRQNLGTTAGLVAAASLLVDYILTVAVSIAAGVFAIVSLAPDLTQHRVTMAIGFIGLITLLNLRGLRESGVVFAIPTYAFLLSIFAMIGVGLTRCLFATCPQAPAHSAEQTLAPLSIFLILRAFSSGATALTGVEAIADGVQAFHGRRPTEQARNASATLGLLGVLSISLFLGLTILARVTGVTPSEEISVVAQIAHATFGGGAGFIIVQITTAAILILAANTAYQDFPRLSSILARDRFMPRQFINQGDRLVFSNGILMLAGLATMLVVIFDADVTRLIQLYVVGVFTSFTLSQAGMVIRQRRLREPGWVRGSTISLVGAVTTGVVLIVVASTKFMHGAWIVIASVPVIVLLFRTISRHYTDVAAQLRMESEPVQLEPTIAVVLAPRIDRSVLAALGTAKALRPREVRALHLASRDDAAFHDAWTTRVPSVALSVLSPRGGVVPAIRDEIRRMAAETPGGTITVVVPGSVRHRGIRGLLEHRRALLLKATLLFEPGVVVTDVPTPKTSGLDPDIHPIEPNRIFAIVPVSGVHNATMRALSYARSLSPTTLDAVTFNVYPRETEAILDAWTDLDTDVTLEAIDAPYRDIIDPLLKLIRRKRRTRPDAIVNVIMPEFVVRRWWHQALHNQTALSIKAALLFEPGVVVTSVPTHLS